MRPEYSLAEIRAVSALLEQKRTLEFAALPNGLFPAAALGKEHKYTGYSYVWVRDNIHVAHAHYRVGHTAPAIKCVRALMEFFLKYQHRFLAIIQGKADPNLPMNRPHIRFDGRSLEEIGEKWAHAQNDALGYFLWLFSKLVNERAFTPTPAEREMLALFPAYFDAIHYWEDEDSGHWEEVRKVSASSIGAVVAGLREFREFLRASETMRDRRGMEVSADDVERLLQQGQHALHTILPAECVQDDPAKNRPYDAALLFLVYPLQIVTGSMADQILANVRIHLQGDYGVRRYLLDSYWAPDYRRKVKPAQRTADFSDDLSGRNKLLGGQGQEAQWCIFDPTLSSIFGTRYQNTHSSEDRARQIEYLNRSLAQITSEDQTEVPAFRCPELYYMEHGSYVPNDHVPLLWTQANLMLALKMMEENCSS